MECQKGLLLKASVGSLEYGFTSHDSSPRSGGRGALFPHKTFAAIGVDSSREAHFELFVLCPNLAAAKDIERALVVGIPAKFAGL